jgi:hypothetical protein
MDALASRQRGGSGALGVAAGAALGAAGAALGAELAAGAVGVT